jgi:excinuclease ABC subunit B
MSTPIHAVASPSLPEGRFVSYPDSPFQLFQPYPPAGDQPTAIEQLVEGWRTASVPDPAGRDRLGQDLHHGQRDRPPGAAGHRVRAQQDAGGAAVQRVPRVLPKNAVEYFVSYYDYYQPEAYVPQRDLFIEKDSAINEHIEQMRLSATKSLLERRDVVIVATVSPSTASATRGLPQMRMTCAGDKLGQRDAIAQLIRMQYQRNDMDFQRGTFRVRGDTIDVFPAEHSELAVRIELFDDEVEACAVRPAHRPRAQKMPRFTVYPSSHYVTPREDAGGGRDHQGGAGRAPEALRGRRQAGGGPAPGAAHALRPGDAGRAGPLQGHRELHAPPVGRGAGRAAATLTDYLPRDALMFLDESHQMIGQLNAMYNGDRSRKTTLVEYGFRLPSALDNRPLKFEEFERRMRQVIFVSPRRPTTRNSTPARWWSRWCGPPAWSTPRSRCARPRTRWTTCCRKSASAWRRTSAC